MKLYEKYRPATWAEVIGQDAAVKTILRLRDAGNLGGQVLYIVGGSGQGKTTCARLAACEIADPLCIEECDATDMSAAAVRDIESRWRLSGWGKGGRAYIVNEAHGLRKDAVRQWLTSLERQPNHCLVVFTSTNDAAAGFFEDKEDAGPFGSRCIMLALSRRNLAEPFARRVREIAVAEHMDGKPVEAYMRLAHDCRSNFRAMLQAVQMGRML